jgi:predicted SnoaL-like aldol condensation-catalyzing enzyme
VQPSRIDRIRTLLRGIETGDPESGSVVSPSQYIQHNPQTHIGREGLAALFARRATPSPRVNLVRAFADGDFVFGQTEYDFATRRIGFEVFRFEGEFAVEHWDNIQPRMGPNPSGHSMVDGPTVATDLHLTESTRALVLAFVQQVRVNSQVSGLEAYVSADQYVEHSPDGADGLAALRGRIQDDTSGPHRVVYRRVHRVLAQGNFALAVSEGSRGSVHTAFYDLYRVEAGKLVEHWDTVESVAPPEDWKHENGRF